MRTVLAGQLTVHTEAIAAAKQAFVALQTATRLETGCIRYVFASDLSEPARFHIFEEWESEAAMAKHMQTAHFAAFAQQLPTVLAGPLEVTQYAVSGSAPFQGA